MGVTPGFSEYVCEGCKKQAMVKDDDNTAKNKWRTVRRINADGQEINRLLCEGCSGEYSSFAAEQDTAFNSFMASLKNRTA